MKAPLTATFSEILRVHPAGGRDFSLGTRPPGIQSFGTSPLLAATAVERVFYPR